MGSWGRFNSGDRTRTCDPLVNSQLLYQLSYAGSVRTMSYEAAGNKELGDRGVN